MIPIFDLPKHYANLKYAETQQKLAIIDYRRTIAKSLMEIKEATDSLRISQENVAIVRKELASQSESFTKNKLRYDAGYADLYTYYEALDIFTSTKIELESKRQQVILNSVAVLNVIGG
jgi:outer membrane protein TolC